MAKERTELRHRTAAMVDPLTGISNRRAFLQDVAALAKRHLDNPRPAAVLLIDLDHFKSINDRFGHAIGDRVLELFAETAQKNLRASDLLGRLGGEEFAAVMYDTSEVQALEMAERLRVAFEQITQNVEDHAVCATMSVGLAHCQVPMLDVPSLLAQADQALYFAKERGRNRVELASLGMVMDRKNSADIAPASQSAA